MVRSNPKTVENLVQPAEYPPLLSCVRGETAGRHRRQGIQRINTYLSRVREEIGYVSKCNMPSQIIGSTGFYPLYPLNHHRLLGVST